MNERIWQFWHTFIAPALAVLGIGLVGASAGGEDYEDWIGIGS